MGELGSNVSVGAMDDQSVGGQVSPTVTFLNGIPLGFGTLIGNRGEAITSFEDGDRQFGYTGRDGHRSQTFTAFEGLQIGPTGRPVTT